MNSTISGVIFITIFATVATLISKIESINSLGFSPLIIGIVISMIYANTLNHLTPKKCNTGITFCSKDLLRFAIVFYGFNITFQQITEVGLAGFMVSLIMLISTFFIGVVAGTKLFKMDRDTSILNASGAAVCGAAAVLATESVIKPQEHKTTIAVSMVVIFGTIAMFLYPTLYNTGFLDMSSKEFGIYVGGTVHEVAQVVAISSSVPNNDIEVQNTAVIVKMTRVLMIAPMLIILGIYLSYKNRKKSNNIKLIIPWFAVYFILVAGFNSLDILPQNIVKSINQIDTFLLTMAMCALGIKTVFSKFKSVGLAPIYTASLMFIWLLIGGYFITKWIVSIF